MKRNSNVLTHMNRLTSCQYHVFLWWPNICRGIYTRIYVFVLIVYVCPNENKITVSYGDTYWPQNKRYCSIPYEFLISCIDLAQDATNIWVNRYFKSTLFFVRNRLLRRILGKMICAPHRELYKWDCVTDRCRHIRKILRGNQNIFISQGGKKVLDLSTEEEF